MKTFCTLIIGGALFAGLSFSGYGQIKLYQIAQQYEEGRFERVIQEAPDYLSQSGLKASQREEALQYLTQSYLFLQEKDSAVANYQRILRENPYFEPGETAPERFLALTREYVARPSLRWRVFLGGNLSNGRLDSTFQVAINDPGEGEKLYLPKGGWQLGMGADVRIYRNLFLRTDLSLAQRNIFIRQETEILNPARQDGSHEQTLRYREYYTYGELPLAGMYEFKPLRNKSQRRYYVELGFRPAFLLRAQRAGIELDRDDRFTDEENNGSFWQAEEFDFEEAPQNIWNSRIHQHYSWFYGLGIRWPMGRGLLSLEFRQNQGLINLVNPETRYHHPSNLFDLQLIDDDFRLNSTSLTVSYSWLKRHKIISKTN